MRYKTSVHIKGQDYERCVTLRIQNVKHRDDETG